MNSARGLRAQVESLLKDELWDSAETLGGLLATSTVVDGLHPGERAAHVSLFADALLGKREFRRALHHYARALELNRLAPTGGVHPEAETPTPMGTRQAMGTPGESPSLHAPGTPGVALVTPLNPVDTPVGKSPEPVPASHLDESTVKFKMGKCYSNLREWRLALSELETIPARSRTLAVTLALAEAYRRTGYDRASIACYKECLRINPFAVQAMDALADAGVDAAELKGNINSMSQTEPGSDSCSNTETQTVLRLLCEGRCALVGGDVEAATNRYSALQRVFPGDARVSLNLAKCALAGNDKDAALDHFRRRRGVDPRAVEGNDLFAELLRANREEGEGDTNSNLKPISLNAHDADDEFGLGGYGVLSSGYGIGGTNALGTDGELRSLVSESLESNSDAPEAWIAAAVYWSSRGQVTRALSYADKALRIDDRKKTAHLQRGHLCLRLRRPEDAVVSFRTAVALTEGAGSANKKTSKKDRNIYTSSTHVTPRAGLCAAYLQQRRRKEALATAKEALALAPNNSNAHALVGDAYLSRGVQNAPVGVSASTESKSRAEKAKKHFKTALELEPGNARVTLALSEALRNCGESDAAIETLRAHLDIFSSSSEVRVRVACHCALGAALASARMLADAAGEYQHALGLDPESEGARRGIARVERLMKGQDPDANDDADEECEDDEDEDGEDDGDDEDEGDDLFE